MALSIAQKALIIVFIALFCGMYFGCETTTKEIQLLEKSRSVEPMYLDIQQELKVAQQTLPKEDRLDLESFLVNIEDSGSDSEKVEAYKGLAGKWYNLSKPILSGYYAEKIAEIENTEDAWAIAGTTNYLGLSTAKTDNQKKYARQHALSNFEKASSLDPSNMDHKINSALCYVEYPEEDQPMQGILMLLDLVKANPESIPVHMQLGRLGVRTNQWDNALKRFRTVLELDPDNKEVHCYLIQVYEAQNDIAKAKESAELCQLR